MIQETGIASHIDVSRLVILSGIVIFVVVVLTLVLAWAKSKREAGSGIKDIDWDQERKVLEALAREKKAMRDRKKHGGNPGGGTQHGGSNPGDDAMNSG